ncbi:uncharacterized protein UDID_07992 [Ustilago sp. UG-2017a]|nr:uncharacterized protein UDID_07992 [Ustilago sp. UG-2017a]
MTRGVEHINPDPDIIPARVNIHHLQLRDLLQPTGIKDKVLFVSRLQVEQADFTTLKQPSTYCTLDFQPNCLATGCGLLAAGGQHGELALRPLHSPVSSVPHLQLDSSYGGERPPAPWLLRTPTGGSINNAIAIQHDLNHPSSSRLSSSHTSGSASATPSKADIVDASPPFDSPSHYHWARDEPSSSSDVARPGLLFGDQEIQSEISHSVFQELAAAYGFDPSSVNRSSRWRSSPATRAAATSSSATIKSSQPAFSPNAAPIKVMVSNNDQSIKLYKLRPPKHHLPSTNNRIESGLPGLSRNTTLHFPTAINHSSLSPDQRTLISVGDTPDVFIHSVARSGEHVKVATYSASSDACFSTTWSPDGSKFAVASQDGIVSVWDVRSSTRLAAVSTSQASVASGSGAARVVKFSPCGRFLAFTEHRNHWGITDTVTFQETQRLVAPQLSSVYPGEGWNSASRPASIEDRFSLLTGGAGVQETIARDRERRSMIHATFMREWNRAINLVDRGPESASFAINPFSTASGTTPSGTTPSTTASAGSRGSNYFPDWLTNPTSTTSVESSIRRREDLLAAALTQGGAGYRPSSTFEGHTCSSSTNISGLCWDPDGESVFVSTERVVAKYNVNDTRLSCSHATLL